MEDISRLAWRAAMASMADTPRVSSWRKPATAWGKPGTAWGKPATARPINAPERIINRLNIEHLQAANILSAIEIDEIVFSMIPCYASLVKQGKLEER
jgi:hypothetical protein